MGLFGPSEREISWEQFAAEVGGTIYNPSWFRFWESYQVSVYKEPWTITLDTYKSGNQYWSSTFTRLSAPYIGEDGFWFTIYVRGIFSTLEKLTLAKLFGTQAIEVGYPELDRAFTIKVNEESKAQALFGNTKIRHLIQTLVPDSDSLKVVKPRYGSPALQYTEGGTIINVDRLKAILELITEVLNQMREFGSALPLLPSK